MNDIVALAMTQAVELTCPICDAPPHTPCLGMTDGGVMHSGRLFNTPAMKALERKP